jgi:hypothetical protein
MIKRGDGSSPKYFVITKLEKWKNRKEQYQVGEYSGK